MEAVGKMPIDRRPLFPYIMGGVLLFEAAVLLLTPVRPSRQLTLPPHTFKVALAPPPLVKPKPPEPVPKPRTKPKMAKKAVVKRPVQPPVLPVQTATSTNLLTASAGTSVSMNWGAGSSLHGAGSGYKPPVLLSKVDTDSLYTDKMKANDEEGDVVVDLWVDSHGKIIRSRMVIPSVWDDMNSIAQNVLKTLKFSPAMLKGQPVAGKFELNFRFRIRNSG